MKGGGRQSGYTLIEILIVVVVLAIVASIALASLWTALDRAKQRATMADIRTISRAIEAYQVDNGYVPSAPGMAALHPILIPYHSSVLPVDDHWGHVYTYLVDSGGNYTVESFGKDGVDGADITLATRSQFDRDIVLSNGQFIASPE